MKIFFLLFFLCVCVFCMKKNEDINAESNILARCEVLRHGWYSIKIPVEGAVMLSLLSCLKTLNFSHDIQVP